MTLHDRLAERANRTPPGDPQDVLAAARARAAVDPRNRRSIPALALSAAAILVLLVVGIAALTGGGGDDAESVTVAGPDEVPADDDGSAAVTVNIEGLEGVEVSSSPLTAAEDAWFEHTLTLENTSDQRLVFGDPQTGTMIGDNEIAVATGGCGWYLGLEHSDAAEEEALMSCASAYQSLALEPGGSQTIGIKAWRDLAGMNPVGAGPHIWKIPLGPERGPPSDEPEAWGTITVTYTDIASFDGQHAVQDEPSEAAPDTGSPVGDWQLDSVAVDGEPILFSTSIRDPWVGIGADGTLTGAYPCNSFGGRVQVRDQRLVVTDLGQELMGCEGAEGAAESAMVRLLDSDPTWENRDGILHLSGAGIEARLSPRTAAPPPTEPARGSTAVWTIDDTVPPSPDSDSFTALVTRLGCSGDQTGEVLEPQVTTEDDRIVVTFAVAPLPEGAYPCPGNDLVPYTVQLDDPIGSRELVDGACLSGEAASTSFCEAGAVRWRP